MIFELRIYHMHPGRMPAIHERFSQHTMDLFVRHGIEVVDFWEDAEGGDTLYYVVAFPDRETRDARFAAFGADPDWQAAKTASEADGPIVASIDSHFMRRVPYAPSQA